MMSARTKVTHLSIAAVIAGLLFAAPVSAQDLGIEVGSTAPAVTVQSLDGKTVKFVNLAVAINQSPEKVRRFLAAHPLPHETFYDTDGKAAGAFDAPATSYVVVLDKAGKVVYTGLGGKQDLETALRKAL
jgi:hypothetical protein